MKTVARLVFGVLNHYTNRKLHTGVYKTYEAALQNAKVTGQIFEYDKQGANDEYYDYYKKYSLEAKDAERFYPVLMYLSYILQNSKNTNVFDLGGGMGVLYYRLRNYLDLSQSVGKWYIKEVPILKEGIQEFAKRMGTDQVYSTDSYDTLADCQVFLGHYCLQVVPEDLEVIFQDHRPEHVVIGDAAITHAELFYTVANKLEGRTHVKKIYNQKKFEQFFLDRGYELVDRWKRSTARWGCEVFGHPNHRKFLIGYYFRLKK